VATQLSCHSLVEGLDLEDCEYMASIGMLSQGNNAVSADDNQNGIWIGNDGPNTFTFINEAGVPLTVVMWYMSPYDDQSSFMNARTPEITYSIPASGEGVVFSLANGVPGGWSAIYNRSTRLTQYGQVDNTFGEFSTGEFATIDVSRLVNMAGDPMTVLVQGGCVANMTRCVYACDTGTESCGEEGTYNLLGCHGQNAVQSVDRYGNPTGGCQGWSNGGHVDIILS
jgi:hypothetical protein